MPDPASRAAVAAPRLGTRAWSLAVCVLLAMATGCASTGYMKDRGRDAADIMTFTVGTGAGVKARVGPVVVAIFDNTDLAGLRAGQAFGAGQDLFPNGELYVLPFPIPGIKTDDWSLPFGYETFSHGWQSPSARRGKDVVVQSPLPFVAVSPSAPSYTQVEVAAGMALTLRLGVNPGELLDFLLGFVGVDIYRDDLGRGGGFQTAPADPLRRGPWDKGPLPGEKGKGRPSRP